jgi:hypothetical protein
MRPPRLDVVLRLAAGAVDVLIDGAAGWTEEAGHDESRVSPLRSGVDASNDALHTALHRYSTGFVSGTLTGSAQLAPRRGGP